MILLLLFAFLTASVTDDKGSANDASEIENGYFVMEDAGKEGWKVDVARDMICRAEDSSLAPDCHSLYFTPTREYQVVLPGQRVPKGLHITMDFNTNVKMAKLMDRSTTDADMDKKVSLISVNEKDEKLPIIHKPSDLKDIPKPGPNKRDLTLEEKGSLKDIFMNDLQVPIRDCAVSEHALDILADVAHDLHVGQGIAYQKDFIDHLLLLLVTKQLPDKVKVAKDSSVIIRAKAAKVLVALTSNNQEAIQFILSHSPDFIKNLLDAFKTELLIVNTNTTAKACAVCLKRIFQIIAMVSRTELDGFRLFMNESPFPLLLEAAEHQESLKDKVYTFLNSILVEERLTSNDQKEVQTWCGQFRLDEQFDLFNKFNCKLEDSNSEEL